MKPPTRPTLPANKVKQIVAERQAEGIYCPLAYKPEDMHPFVIRIKERDGVVRSYGDWYPTLEIAQHNAESQRAFFGDLSVESVESWPSELPLPPNPRDGSLANYKG